MQGKEEGEEIWAEIAWPRLWSCLLKGGPRLDRELVASEVLRRQPRLWHQTFPARPTTGAIICQAALQAALRASGGTGAAQLLRGETTPRAWVCVPVAEVLLDPPVLRRQALRRLLLQVAHREPDLRKNDCNSKQMSAGSSEAQQTLRS